MTKLVFRLSECAQGATELEVTISAGDFAGRGKCLVEPTALMAAAEKFAEFPLQANGPPQFEGGYLRSDMTGVSQVHVRISASPFNSAGTVVLTIHLALPVDKGIDEMRAMLKCDIPTTYQCLLELSASMKAAIANVGDAIAMELEGR